MKTESFEKQMPKVEYSTKTGRRLKPCKPGQERNPVTNRPRKKDRSKRLKPCKPGEERNPLTNRCRKMDKAILNKRIKMETIERIKTPTWCNITQMEARRLILKVGLGRDLVIADLPTAQNPNKLCSTLTNMLDASCTNGWKVTKFISAGAFGHVFRVVKHDGKKAVMKVQVGPKDAIITEVLLQKVFHLKGLAPKVLTCCSFEPTTRLTKTEHQRLNALVHSEREVPVHAEGHSVHIIIMEEIAGVVGDWLGKLKSKEQMGQFVRRVFDLMDAFREHKITHADLHLSNLGYVYTDASKKHIKLMPIDFGRSSLGKAHTKLELGALLRGLRKGSLAKPIPDYNRRVMANFIRSVSFKKYGIEMEPTIDLAAKSFEDEITLYMKKKQVR